MSDRLALYNLISQRHTLSIPIGYGHTCKGLYGRKYISVSVSAIQLKRAELIAKRIDRLRGIRKSEDVTKMRAALDAHGRTVAGATHVKSLKSEINKLMSAIETQEWPTTD